MSEKIRTPTKLPARPPRNVESVDTPAAGEESEAVKHFLRESASAGTPAEKRYQRRFVRVLRDLSFTLAGQASRIDSLTMDRKPFQAPEDRQYMQAAVNLFISRDVVPVLPSPSAGHGIGPVKILAIMAVAEQNGVSYESDERAEAMCLTACLIAGGLARTPRVKVSSDIPEIMRRDETLQHLLILCWFLMHSDHIVRDLSARVRKIPRLRTSITKALLPSLIRAAYRVKVTAGALEVSAATSGETDKMDKQFSARVGRVTSFLRQVGEVVRYLWGGDDAALLEDDALLNQVQYGSTMRESLPPVRPTMVLLRNFTESIPRLDPTEQVYLSVDILLDGLGVMSQQGISATQNLVFAAISSGDDDETPGAGASAEKKPLRAAFVEALRRDRGVGGTMVSARVAIIEAELDLYMALTVPKDASVVASSSGNTPQKSRLRKIYAYVQERALQVSRASDTFRIALLENVRHQMDAILALVASTAVGQAATNTEAGYTSAHTSVVLQLAPMFAHFLAVAVALGFYTDQQRILAYFPFGRPAAAAAAAATRERDDTQYGLMGDLQWAVLQNLSSWLGVMMQLGDGGGGDSTLATMIRSNVLHFLETTLTRESVLAPAGQLYDPLPSPLEDASVALARADDVHRLMVAKRTLRVALRAFVQARTMTADVAAGGGGLTTRTVAYLQESAGFLDTRLTAPPDDVRNSLQISLGLGDLEEYEGTRARRTAFNRWTAIMVKFLNEAAGGLSQSVVSTALLRLCTTATGDDQTSTTLRNVYAAVGILDILRDQPAMVTDALLAAHLWSLQQQEQRMTAFVQAEASSGGDSDGFSQYGSITLSELARGVEPSDATNDDDDASDDSDNERLGTPAVRRKVNEASPDSSLAAAAVAEDASTVRYPTKDDSVLANVLSAVLLGAANGSVDPAWVSSVLAPGLGEMLSESDVLQPTDISAASSRNLVGAVVDDVAEMLKAATESEAEAKAEAEAEAPLATEQAAPETRARYGRLSVAMHLVPETELLDPRTGLWSVYEIPPVEQHASGLLVVGRIAVPTRSLRPTTAGQQREFIQNSRQQIKKAFSAGVNGALAGSLGTVTLEDPRVHIVILPYVDPSLAAFTRELFADITTAAEVESIKTSTPVAFINATPAQAVFVPVLRGTADAANVILCFAHNPDSVKYLREAAMRLASVLAAAAQQQGLPRSDGRITQQHFLLLASWTLYLFVLGEVPELQDGQLVRVVDRDSMDTANLLVEFTQVLIFRDLPVFWLLQILSELRSQPTYRPMAVIIAYTDRDQFVDAVVAHRCVRMEMQMNLLHKVVAAGPATVAIHPQLLTELLGVRTTAAAAMI